MQNKTKQSGSRWNLVGIKWQIETQEYSNIEKPNDFRGKTKGKC